MIGCFYNKNSLNDTLILNVSNEKPIKIDQNNNYCLGFDKNNDVCFINIFNFSKYGNFDKNYFLFNDQLNKIVMNVCKVDLSKYVNINNFVIGHIDECEEISGTHLHKCKVNIGNQILDIVCGAKNARKDLNVVVATIGAILPNGKRINKGKLLGIESFGMLCSAKELGITNKKFNDQGIIELNSIYPVGSSFNEMF